MSNQPLSPERAQEYWKRTSGLMYTMLGIWFVASFLVHMFAPTLNAVSFMGFPLGFYMAAQGSLLIFVVAIFWYSGRQNAIDEEFGVADE